MKEFKVGERVALYDSGHRYVVTIMILLGLDACPC